MTTSLPPGYIACPWCGAGNLLPPSSRLSDVKPCHICGLGVAVTTTELRRAQQTVKKAAPAARTSAPRKRAPARKAPVRKRAQARKSAVARTPAKKHTAPTRTSTIVGIPHPQGQLVIGVDPGARYTGVVVRNGEIVVHSTTLVRPKELDGVTWAKLVVEGVQEILKEFGAIPMGLEGISDPKGFQNGKRAAINPRDIIRTGIVVGAVAVAFPDAQIIAPGKNGSRGKENYPPVLVGRRPKTLPGDSNGAGTRNHEQSAFDVAGKVVLAPKR
jgi:hypothetical protein